MKTARTWSAIAVVLTIGCNQGPDAGDHIRTALKEANIPTVQVAVDAEENIVHLKGIVGSTVERARAEEIAAATVGTSGQVLNEVMVAGLNDRNAGDLDGEINKALDKMVDADAVLRERDVNFDVHNGMVAIRGEVRTAAEKTRASVIAKAVPGVRDVANGLEIKPE